MPTLFEIGNDLLAINEALEAADGDLDAIPGLAEWFDTLANDQASKLDGYIGLVKQLEMESAAAKAEADQWAAKARSRTNRVEYLKRRLLDHLTRTGQSKAKTATGRVVAVVANGGAVPIALATDVTADAFPDRLCRIRREIDRDAIRAVLEAGESIPFATFGERGKHLRIS